MTHPTVEQRAATLAEFREIAARLFAEQPHVRSLLLAFAEWRDPDDEPWNPNDVVHSRVVTSMRDVPLWPHVCSWYADAPHGETCDQCGSVGTPSAPIAAWSPYCQGDVGQLGDAAYLPYAIARRGVGTDGIALEIVGALQRGTPEPTARRDGWLANARIRELFDEVCAAPDDDGPRAVLADYLLESRRSTMDPRGEAIALSLAPHLDAAAIERRDSLIAHYAQQWIHPLDAVIPVGGARFARGFLVSADVCVRDKEAQKAVAGARVWGTVEAIRYLPGSRDFIDEAMTALRDVGIVRRDGIAAIAAAPRPWRIRRMHVLFEQAQTARWASYGPSLEAVSALDNLPELRALVLGFDSAERPWMIEEAVPRLPAAPWWPQLELLTLVLPAPSNLGGWREHHRRLGVPWLAIAHADGNGEPAGWQFAFGPNGTIEVSVAGWHQNASLAALAPLVASLPSSATVQLVPSAFRTFAQDDLDFLAPTQRTIVLRR